MRDAVDEMTRLPDRRWFVTVVDMARSGWVSTGAADLATKEQGAGVPVLVIGAALTVDELSPVSRLLAEGGGLRLIDYHRRGYAGSAPLLAPRSVDDEAADAAALIAALDAGPVHVVGASYAAAIALALAASSPELVRRVAVLEPPPYGTPGTAAMRRSSRAMLTTYEQEGTTAALEQMMTLLVGPGWREADPAELGATVAEIERDAGTFFGSDLRGLLGWHPSDRWLRAIETPVLWLGGDRSAPWFGEMRARLSGLLPHYSELTVEGAGHLLAVTHPDAVAAALRAFFRGDAEHPAAG